MGCCAPLPSPEQIVATRSLVRHREMLVRYRSAYMQHMQKASMVRNLRLTKVLSDITGLTGMKIVRAIVAGELNPHTLAQLRDERCAKSETDIAKSLEGHYKPEQVFMLKRALKPPAHPGPQWRPSGGHRYCPQAGQHYICRVEKLYILS